MRSRREQGGCADTGWCSTLIGKRSRAGGPGALVEVASGGVRLRLRGKSGRLNPDHACRPARNDATCSAPRRIENVFVHPLSEILSRPRIDQQVVKRLQDSLVMANEMERDEHEKLEEDEVHRAVLGRLRQRVAIPTP